MRGEIIKYLISYIIYEIRDRDGDGFRVRDTEGQTERQRRLNHTAVQGIGYLVKDKEYRGKCTGVNRGLGIRVNRGLGIR